jgi:uncharacterized protein with GYD domain
MAKYLFLASFTADGLTGLKKAGAASRVAAISEMCQSAGGTLESYYFAFGDVDVFVTVDLPDDEAAAAVAFTVASAGVVKLSTVKLLTVDEADAALGRSVTYRPPGS